MGRVFLRDMGYMPDIVPQQLMEAYHEVRRLRRARPMVNQERSEREQGR
jgi:hypothetical protein